MVDTYHPLKIAADQANYSIWETGGHECQIVGVGLASHSYKSKMRQTTSYHHQQQAATINKLQNTKWVLPTH